MPKASPSKAPLPKKPREPKKVKDVALNTMRVANYQAKLAVYEEEMAAYKVGQRERKVDKRSAQRRLSAGDAEPAAKRPTPARRETPEACAAGSAEAARAPPAKPLRRLPQVLREEKEAAAAAQAAAEAKFEAAKQAATEAQEEAARLAALPGQTFAAAELALSRPLKILSLEEEEAELRLQLEALVASQRGVEETLGRVTAERAALEREDAEAAAGGETVIGKVVPIAAGVGKAVAAVNRLTTSLPLPKKAE
mmetsp:Transcript_20955/g.68614  ORF Transcript_20955/g.68614 Transcript_20955/m.68614 type:complete len:253 (-) Transcript_20955:229-987(-)